MNVLADPTIRSLIRLAWEESRPGASDAHEEGGFVLRQSDGSLLVERWPRGLQDQITVPTHAGGRWNGLDIVATFHTHPNPGDDYQQEPSLTDIRAVRDDLDLHGREYEGEYVISSETVYRILPDGNVEHVGNTAQVLNT